MPDSLWIIRPMLNIALVGRLQVPKMAAALSTSRSDLVAVGNPADAEQKRQRRYIRKASWMALGSPKSRAAQEHSGQKKTFPRIQDLCETRTYHKSIRLKNVKMEIIFVQK